MIKLKHYTLLIVLLSGISIEKTIFSMAMDTSGPKFTRYREQSEVEEETSAPSKKRRNASEEEPEIKTSKKSSTASTSSEKEDDEFIKKLQSLDIENEKRVMMEKNPAELEEFVNRIQANPFNTKNRQIAQVAQDAAKERLLALYGQKTFNQKYSDELKDPHTDWVKVSERDYR